MNKMTCVTTVADTANLPEHLAASPILLWGSFFSICSCLCSVCRSLAFCSNPGIPFCVIFYDRFSVLWMHVLLLVLCCSQLLSRDIVHVFGSKLPIASCFLCFHGGYIGNLRWMHMLYTSDKYELKVQRDDIDRFWEMFLND
jgi:hypothetical protein